MKPSRPIFTALALAGASLAVVTAAPASATNTASQTLNSKSPEKPAPRCSDYAGPVSVPQAHRFIVLGDVS